MAASVSRSSNQPGSLSYASSSTQPQPHTHVHYETRQHSAEYIPATPHKGIATEWTGVDMPTPLLPEGVPEIDADPLSLDGRCGGRGR